MTQEKTMSRRPGAFTLVELLFVIAILSILASLLLPCLRRAMETARKIQCANNLRSIGFGHLQYMDDNGRYVADIDSWSGPMRYWYRHVGSYLYPGEPLIQDTPDACRVFRCPSKGEDQGFMKYISYGMNLWQPWQIFGSSATSAQYPYKSNMVRNPTQTMISMDSYGNERVCPDSAGASYALLNVIKLTDRHMNGCNALFFDGHVNYLHWPYPNCATTVKPYLWVSPHEFWISYQ
jgi:prepilin-type processing-associated H-X9-DG protein/prepilin-type N-terminal cleavage/methylation domain-containing protein